MQQNGFRDVTHRSSPGKKIKRRLEDLEKRASSSPSPEQGYKELQSTAKTNSRRTPGARRQSVKREGAQQQSRKPAPEPLVTPYSSLHGRHADTSPSPYTREVSLSPPHPINYSFSMSSPNISAPFSPPPSYNTPSHPFTEYPSHSPYLPTIPNTLPAMSTYEPSSAKTASFFDDGNVASQYGLGYTPFSSMELPIQPPYSDSNINVNLPDEYNFFYEI